MVEWHLEAFHRLPVVVEVLEAMEAMVHNSLLPLVEVEVLEFNIPQMDSIMEVVVEVVQDLQSQQEQEEMEVEVLVELMEQVAQVEVEVDLIDFLVLLVLEGQAS
jgi:hypothetical protein